MDVIICPGVHSPELTQSFLEGLGSSLAPNQVYVFPSERFPAYSALHVVSFVQEQLAKRADNTPLLWIGFSAGVVGTIGAARHVQRLGCAVKALIAIDGWGVPLWGDFPIHRVSHDFFTHWSSLPLGQVDSCFWAEPGVPHLELWRSPQTTQGWSTEACDRSALAHLGIDLSGQKRYHTTAAQYLHHLLIRCKHHEIT